MSRTDIHRPVWVMYLDPLMREHFRVFHHHPDGVCDLAVFEQSQPNWVRTNCRWQWWSHLRPCGCQMCTGQPYRRLRNRQERRAGRRGSRTAVAQHRASEMDPDGPRVRRAKAW